MVQIGDSKHDCRPIKIDKQTIDNLSTLFNEDLSTVEFYRYKKCFHKWVIFSRVASAESERIYLSDDAFDEMNNPDSTILCHELAHVIQKRLGCRNSAQNTPPWILEIEAHLVSILVVRGQKVRIVGVDPSPEQRAWDEAGHYYTAYFILLAAGVDNVIAQKLAFYSQVPDLIWELDAVGVWKLVYTIYSESPKAAWASQVKNLGDFLESPRISARQAKAPVKFYEERGRMTYYSKHLKDMLYSDISNVHQFLRTIQIGLHCLNGGSSTAEQEFREKQLMRLDMKNMLTFGLAIHALGDSYAHTDIKNEDLMYPTYYGHGKDYFRNSKGELTCELFFDDAIGGHTTDNIANRSRKYLDYGEALFRVLIKKMGNFKKRPVPDEEAIRNLLLLAASTDKSSEQIAILKIMSNLCLRGRLLPGASERLRQACNDSPDSLGGADAVAGLSMYAKQGLQNSALLVYSPANDSMPWNNYTKEQKDDTARGYYMLSATELENCYWAARNWTNRDPAA